VNISDISTFADAKSYIKSENFKISDLPAIGAQIDAVGANANATTVLYAADGALLHKSHEGFTV